MIKIFKSIYARLRFYLRWLADYFVGVGLGKRFSDDPKGILLVRLDAIGDYILFRNFIEALKNSRDFADQPLVLVGNEAWRELAEMLDQAWVDRFVWVNRRRFGRDLLYRRRKLQEVCVQNYALVIQPALSREFFYGDTLVRFASARQKIGSQGDFSNIAPWQKKISDKFYTKLLPAEIGIMFEFERNREFFSALLDADLREVKPVIKRGFAHGIKIKLPEKYVVLFIGASMTFRKWPGEFFARVARHLQERGYDIVLCGGAGDRATAEAFSREFGTDFIDLVGKTTLIELLQVIAQGELMLANETSAPHMAVALGVKNIFIIYNGNHYGRFVPYPESMCLNYHVIYHPEIENNLDYYAFLSNSYGYGSNLDIREISVEKVIACLDEVLGKKNQICLSNT